MNLPVKTGRVDLLLMSAMEQLCKQYVDPLMPIPVWSEQTARAAASAIQRAGVPNEPITSVRLGNLDVPLGVVEWIFRACANGGRR